MNRVITIALVLATTACQYDPFAHEFTTKRPSEEQLIGRCAPDLQAGAIGSNLNVMVSPTCELTLRPDHTFMAKALPRCWFPPTNTDCLPGTSDVEGHWTLREDGKWWAVNLNADLPPGGVSKTWNVPAIVRGAKPPYILHLTIGDPDSGNALALVAQAPRA